MSRKRALKKRADFRKGGFVDRKKFQSGGRQYNPVTGVYYDPADAASGDPERQKIVYETETGGTPTTLPEVTARANPPASGGVYFTEEDSSATTSETTPELGRSVNENVSEGTTPTSQATPTSKSNGGTIDTSGQRVQGGTKKFDSGDKAPVIKTDFIDESLQIDASKSRMEDREKTKAPEDIGVEAIEAAQGTAAQADPSKAQVTAATMDVATVGKDALDATEAATGAVTREATADVAEFTDANKVQTAQRDAQQEQEALAKAEEFKISDDAFVGEVSGETVAIVNTTPAERQEREAVIGMPAPSGEEAEIINEFGFGSSKNRVLRGEQAKTAASNRLINEHGLDAATASALVEDMGELVTNIDGIPQESLGAVATLPKEALVSSQMESLLAGMEDGKIPAFARPAVSAIEQRLAERGLSASSVGQEALFNAIIQASLPIAQSNAQALQQRASQNLTNEQQALIQDRQIASDFMSKNAAFTQQMEIANLTNDQQMRLANLSALNQAGSENLSAAQQSELAELNSRMQTNLLQSKLAQEMGIAQLNVDQQRAIQNASMVAKVDMTQYTTEQQMTLSNSKFMQSMTMADFNATQQSAIQNATTMASMDLAAADQNTKLAIENARNFLNMDMANLNNEQQSLVMDQQLLQQRLLSDQAAENAAAQFNASSENQVNQFMAELAKQFETFNATQMSEMSKFNTSETNRVEAINAGNDLEAEKFNSAAQTQIDMYDQELEYKTDAWNAQNEQIVGQSNAKLRRDANTINTAAANESNRLEAQMSFKMSQSEQNFLWQQLRDAEAFAQQNDLTKKERIMQILSSIYGNSELMTDKKFSRARDDLAPQLERELFG